MRLIQPRARGNPKPYPDQPVEITLKNERLDESSLTPLAPGVILVGQISKTGKRVPVTHGEQRLFLCLQDDAGKRSMFYQSFSGTGGKEQGVWFPTGGIMADQRGRGAWVIKGSPRTDPGAGRVPLLEFFQRVNEVLPHTDPATDALLMKLVGMDYGDLSYKDEYESVPFLRITEAGTSSELQKKWGSWAYQFWALNILDKVWGKRTFDPSKVAANPYKASIPIVSGIALENPSPELVKGTRTPYRRYTREWGFLAPINRDIEFTRVIYTLTDVYPFNIHVFRALGSGKHWVGVLAFERGEYEDFILYNTAITLQSGKSWSVAENKILRWFKQPREEEGHYSETGAGSLEFMRWVLEKMNHFREVMQVRVRSPNSKPIRIKAGWGTPQRERAYAWLTRYGFQKVADAGDGDPAYVLDIQYVPKSNPVDLEGRFVPERYLAGLPPALQKQRIRELTESRDAYKRGDYSELPTDRTARKMGLVKQSNYTTEAKKRGVEYRGDHDDMARRVFEFYGHRPSAREVTAFAAALRKSFSKGLAAWKSGGHRPGATAQNWAVARVNSLVVGGKTSWTADKKLFEVLPAEVRAKIESMRTKQNPISVRVQGTPPDNVTGRHARYFMSRKALDHIEEKGASVVPNIELVVAWEGDLRHVKGKPGVITLITSPAVIQGEADRVDKVFAGRELPRAGKVSLFTAHTVLHRLGDMIMPREAGMGRIFNAPLVRGPHRDLVVTNRVEVAWRSLGAALFNARGEVNVDQWLPTVVRTKGCREGWIKDFDQAMAELVPYRLLYNNGRENGVKLLSDLPFVPALEAALTEYIDASMEMLTGYQVKI